MLKTVIALVLFPSISWLALRTTLGYHYFESGLLKSYEQQCTSTAIGGAAKYPTFYSGLAGFDAFLCNLVAFFESMKGHVDGVAYLPYFLGTVLFVFVVPFVEGSRGKFSVLNPLLAFPVLAGQLSQFITAAAAMPWLCLSLIISSKNRSSYSIDQRHAEAVVSGTVFGIIIPSIVMIASDSAYVTALWQICPVLSSITSNAYLYFRKQTTSSGRLLILKLYYALFAVAALAHFYVIIALRGNANDLWKVLVPPIRGNSSAPLSVQAKDFSQWDSIFINTSGLLTCLWIANDIKQVRSLLLWMLVSISLVGPGATVMGALIWRESKFEERGDVASREKTK